MVERRRKKLSNGREMRWKLGKLKGAVAKTEEVMPLLILIPNSKLYFCSFFLFLFFVPTARYCSLMFIPRFRRRVSAAKRVIRRRAITCLCFSLITAQIKEKYWTDRLPAWRHDSATSSGQCPRVAASTGAWGEPSTNDPKIPWCRVRRAMSLTPRECSCSCLYQLSPPIRASQDPPRIAPSQAAGTGFIFHFDVLDLTQGTARGKPEGKESCC